MERTMMSKTGFRAWAVLLSSLALAGCSKDPAGVTDDPGRKGTVLSIAEVNYAVSGGGSKSAESAQDGTRAGAASGDGTPQTRAIVGGNGSTFFTDRDRLGLFLRGDGYEDVDNRIVQLDYPGEGSKKWNITGPEITLYGNEATVTAYFPYADHTSLSAVELLPGPYDVNTRDVVWQRDKVHSAHTQAMFLEMRHALTRVKIRLKRGKLPVHEVGDVVDGGVVYWVNPNDASDYGVVAMDQIWARWRTGTNYGLDFGGSGHEFMMSARAYSLAQTDGASGDFAKDYPSLSHCYEKTDGGVPKGTWYIPVWSQAYQLHVAHKNSNIDSVVVANGGVRFDDYRYWTTRDFGMDGYCLGIDLGSGNKWSIGMQFARWGRCVRDPLILDNISDDNSDPGDYLGKGKVSGITIADGDGVPREERVIYTSGRLDLTSEEPRVSGRSLGAVSDGNVFNPDYLSEEGLVYDLLLLPVDKIGEGRIVLNLDIDDKLLSVPFPVDRIDRWEAGRAYVYDVYVRNGEATVVFGKATVTPWNDGGSITGSLDPSYPGYGGGDVQDWGDNEWETDGETQIRDRHRVGDLYGGGVVYWVNPDDATDFRVVEMSNSSTAYRWAASDDYVLGAGAQDETARNGAGIMALAKAYSDAKTNGATGVFATDFPAFAYCYNKMDGGVAKGTWFVPSYAEACDLHLASAIVDDIIVQNGGSSLFLASDFYRHITATETASGGFWSKQLHTGNFINISGKKTVHTTRCVRSQ